MTCRRIPCILSIMAKKKIKQLPAVLHIKDFPRGLQKELQIAKAVTGRTTREIVIEAVNDWLEWNK